MTTAPPDSCAVAFKEWAGVCDALGSGRQSLILRKGGVSEGPGGFRPEHPAFWLYPTRVHEAEQKLRTPPRASMVEVPGVVAIDALAVVEWTGRVEGLEPLKAIESLHDWTDETIRQRFHYRSPGLWALSVRVYRGAEPWSMPVTPEHLGCKTWVPLEAPRPTSGLIPVIDDGEALGRLERLLLALGASC